MRYGVSPGGRVNKKQVFADIFDALKIAAEVMGDPLHDSEYRAMAHRLLPFQGATLYRQIAALPHYHKKMPTGWDMEQEIRKTLGKPPMPGLTLAAIDENERAAVVAGQDPALARKGADMLRKALKERPEAAITLIDKPSKNAAAKIAIDRLAGLEDFGEENISEKNLAALEDF